MRRWNPQATPFLLMTSSHDPPLPPRLTLSLLWTATMVCYLYCDYFALYVPGKIQTILDGRMEPFGAITQGVLLGTGVLLLVPALMVALSAVLPFRASRLLNLAVGGFYTLLMVAIGVQVDWHFYQLYALAEVVLTGSVVWMAWRWRPLPSPLP